MYTLFLNAGQEIQCHNNILLLLCSCLCDLQSSPESSVTALVTIHPNLNLYQLDQSNLAAATSNRRRKDRDRALLCCWVGRQHFCGLQALWGMPVCRACL